MDNINLAVSVNLVNEILGYLQNRPYGEVNILISKIMSLSEQLREKPKMEIVEDKKENAKNDPK